MSNFSISPSIRTYIYNRAGLPCISKFELADYRDLSIPTRKTYTYDSHGKLLEIVCPTDKAEENPGKRFMSFDFLFPNTRAFSKKNTPQTTEQILERMKFLQDEYSDVTPLFLMIFPGLNNNAASRLSKRQQEASNALRQELSRNGGIHQLSRQGPRIKLKESNIIHGLTSSVNSNIYSRRNLSQLIAKAQIA